MFLIRTKVYLMVISASVANAQQAANLEYKPEISRPMDRIGDTEAMEMGAEFTVGSFNRTDLIRLYSRALCGSVAVGIGRTVRAVPSVNRLVARGDKVVSSGQLSGFFATTWSEQ